MDFYTWKQLLKNLALPPTGPLLLMLAGFILSLGRRPRPYGYALSIAGAVLLWLLATPVVADALVRAVERYPALDLHQPVDAQAVVILAGGVRRNAPEYGTPAPGATTLERLVYGARVARTLGLPVLVSGSKLEAASMKDFLHTDLGVTARWVENRSRDTHENAQFSAVILARAGVHKVILVTSSAHMARSVVEFNMAGIETVPAPAAMWTRRDDGILDLIPNADALLRSQRACYEAGGRLVQILRARFQSITGLFESAPAAPAKT